MMHYERQPVNKMSCQQKQTPSEVFHCCITEIALQRLHNGRSDTSTCQANSAVSLPPLILSPKSIVASILSAWYVISHIRLMTHYIETRRSRASTRSPRRWGAEATSPKARKWQSSFVTSSCRV